MLDNTAKPFSESILDIFREVGNSDELLVIGYCILNTRIDSNHIPIFQFWQRYARKFGWLLKDGDMQSFYLKVRKHIEAELTCQNNPDKETESKPFCESIIDVLDDITETCQLLIVGALIGTTELPANNLAIRQKWQQLVLATGQEKKLSGVTDHIERERIKAEVATQNRMAANGAKKETLDVLNGVARRG